MQSIDQSEPVPPLDRRDGLALMLVLLVAAVVIGVSWQRWLEPIIDTGRDLYIPPQIASGQMLYRDLRYNYPPLTPYLLAAWISLFGRSLTSYASFSALVAFIIVAVLYLTARRVAGRSAALAVTTLFVSLNLTGASTWGANFIFPYAFAATLGALWVLVTLLGSVLLSQRSSPRGFALVLGGGLAAILTKIELIAPVAFLIAVLWIARRINLRQLASFAGAAVLAFFACSILFHSTVPGTHWLYDNILNRDLLQGESARTFFRVVSGSSDKLAALIGSSTRLAGAMAIVLLLFILDRVSRTQRRRVPTTILLLAAVSILIFRLADGDFFRLFTPGHFAVLPFLWKSRRTDHWLVWAASFGSTIRIAYNITPNWYGFSLILPTYILFGVLVFDLAPRLGAYSRRTSALWFAVVIAISARGIHQQRVLYRMKSLPVETSQGRYFDLPWRAAAVQSFVNDMKQRAAGDLVVFPEGVSLNYFTERKSPISYYLFTPVESGAVAVEKRILSQLDATRPRWVALVTRDVSEYGSRGFGVDYNEKIARLLRNEYEPIARWGAPKFEIILAERRTSLRR